MKYFVTGATGFIGSQICKQLVEAGHSVTALVRDPQRAAGLAAMGISLARGDITEKDSLVRPMEGADGVFHTAGWYKIGARDPRPAEQINVGGTRNVLEVMCELGIPRGVYTSTLAVFSDTHGRLADETYRYAGPHLSEYDRTKWLAHYAVAEPMIQAGLPLIIVQPGVVYGPGDPSSIGDTFRRYLTKKLPLLPQRTAYCWAYIDDAAWGHLLAMEKGRAGESYIIGGPPHTLIEAMVLAASLTGIQPPRLKAPPWMLRGMAGGMDLAGRFITLPEIFSAEALRVAAGVTYLGDNSRARSELGYDPRPLEEGLRPTLAALQREIRGDPLE